jgi:hypothetical protein
VYAALAKPPNRWDHDTTFNNIIRKIDAALVEGSNWDPNSVMHYPFEPGLIKEPAQFRQGLNPSARAATSRTAALEGPDMQVQLERAQVFSPVSFEAEAEVPQGILFARVLPAVHNVLELHDDVGQVVDAIPRLTAEPPSSFRISSASL